MKTRLLAVLMLFGIASVGAADGHLDAQVYIVHGILGQDLGLDAPLPVDISVNGNCALTGFSYGQVAGPLALEPETYAIRIGVANPDQPCSNPPVIAADVPFAPGEVAVVIAHLSAEGMPTASKFVLDYTPAEQLVSRINVQHTAAAPAVDIRLRKAPCNFMDQIALRGIKNGGQATLTSGPETYYVSVSPTHSNEVLIGPLALPIGLSKAYHIFATGSLDANTLTLLIFRSPLENGATLEAVAAQTTVIHGIPGQDLGLPPALPVDISLNGNTALKAVPFGAVTAPLALVAGPYAVDISPANAENPGSNPAVISANVVLHAGSNNTVIAHLDGHGAPTASLFSNQYVGCKSIDHPIFLHHTAAAPAVDIKATERYLDGFYAYRPLHGVSNGQQGVIDASLGELSINVLPANAKHPIVAHTKLTVDGLHSPYLYVVGSLAGNTLTILENNLPRYQSLEALALSLNEEGPYAGQLDSLLAAVLAADPAVLQALAGSDPLTVFAPTDAAFAALGLTPESIPEQDPAFLTEILLTHVVSGALPASEVLAADKLTTLQGSDLKQSNGVLTDPRGGQATIVVTDLKAGNGVIHVIDAVVLPPEPLPSLLDLAVQLNTTGTYAGVFDTLIAAVLAADPSIVAALSGDSPLTVFAPTDDAFAALDLNPDNITDLGQALLTDILLYHVSAGKQLAADVLAQSEIAVLKGGSLAQSGGVLTDNLGRSATIIVTNVEAANGVIHVIDAVVLPVAP